MLKLHVIAILMCIAALTACGSAPQRGGSIDRAPGSSGAPPTRGGGFYLDDGPGANAPANLDAIPDAVPKSEPLHRGTQRPYVVMGRSSTPMTRIEPYKTRGIATWYGRRYHGKPTSSGEPYDMYGMTAAHTVLPIPSYVRVTNVSNGKSVVLRVNDRGPFIGDRLIDLSYTAAWKLGILGSGSGMVDVESIIPGSPEPGKTSGASPNIAPAAVQPVAPAKPMATGFFVQLAAFSSKENADAYLQKIREQKELQGEPLQIRENAGLFRIHAGPYPSDAAARQSAERVARLLNIRPLVSAY